MSTTKLIHISDLHLGKNVDTERRAVAIRDAALAADAHHLVVTGDVTHGGRISELALFWRIFAPLAALDRVTVVPGNHDRLGDDVADAIQAGPRVSVRQAAGLFLVRFDSTGPHNRSWLAGHGAMTTDDVVAICDAVDAAPPSVIVAVVLHHHVLPLPADHTAERLVSWLGWPYAEELEHGRRLLAALRGKCDLVLHGHRHSARAERMFADDRRPLDVFNAGSSTQLGRVRLFTHQRGQMVGPPEWVSTWTAPSPRLHRVDRGRPSVDTGAAVSYP